MAWKFAKFGITSTNIPGPPYDLVSPILGTSLSKSVANQVPHLSSSKDSFSCDRKPGPELARDE
jgi:hypothetical protein